VPEPALRAVCPRPRPTVDPSLEGRTKPVWPPRRPAAVAGTWSAPGLRDVPRAVPPAVPRVAPLAEGRAAEGRAPDADWLVPRAALRPRPKDSEPDDERVPLADGLVPRVALPPRPKNCEPDEERERLRAKGLRLSVEEAPGDARPVLRAVGDTPRVPVDPRLAPYRLQFAVWPADARALARFENEEALRYALGAGDALRAPENAFDLQPDEPDALGMEEPPREPKADRDADGIAGAAARGAEKPPRGAEKPRPPPPNPPRVPRAAPCAGASDASTPHIRREKSVRRSLMANLLASFKLAQIVPLARAVHRGGSGRFPRDPGPFTCPMEATRVPVRGHGMGTFARTAPRSPCGPDGHDPFRTLGDARRDALRASTRPACRNTAHRSPRAPCSRSGGVPRWVAAGPRRGSPRAPLT
jgi:hypothetical protein